MDRIDIDLEPLQHVVGFRIHGLAVDERSLARPAAEEDILADIHIPAQREILVDHLDPGIAAFMWALEVDGLSRHQDLARVTVIGAGQDFHQS